MALTGKKKLFADAVLAGKSNKDAAIKAGYSVKTASAAGSRLVKDKDVVAYLKSAKKPTAKSDKTEPEAQAEDRSVPTFDLNKALQHSDPKNFLIAAMNDALLDTKQRIEAAKALMPFMHQKLGEGGKKEKQADEAKKVASKFGQAQPPKLVAAGGKKV
jgi:phage terminase small subunit